MATLLSSHSLRLLPPSPPPQALEAQSESLLGTLDRAGGLASVGEDELAVRTNSDEPYARVGPINSGSPYADGVRGLGFT